MPLEWNNQKFDLQVKPDHEIGELKENIFQLTGVPVKKQKVFVNVKGKWKLISAREKDLTKFKLDNNIKVKVMGNSEGIPKRTVDVQFVEDLSTKEKVKLSAALPPGLHNLGNTCYANSTIQCLKAVPELQTALKASTATNTLGSDLKNLFAYMEEGLPAVAPTQFVTSMRRAFPAMNRAIPSQAGTSHTQEDADEFMSQLLNSLSTALTTPPDDVEFGDKSNAVDALFGVTASVLLKNQENPEEPEERKVEEMRKLRCQIDGNIKFLEDGLKMSLNSTLTKRSPTLGRDATYSQTVRLNALPLYLTIQLNRFFWKRNPDGQGGEIAKIKKPIKFPMDLDIFELCDEELKNVLLPARELNTRKRAAHIEGAQDQEMPDEDEAGIILSQTGRTAGPGISPKFYGVYELFALVTHVGKSSKSGHYMGWVKQKNGFWVNFDDSDASECRDVDIKKLADATPDSDIPYILLYRVKLD